MHTYPIASVSSLQNRASSKRIPGTHQVQRQDGAARTVDQPGRVSLHFLDRTYPHPFRASLEIISPRVSSNAPDTACYLPSIPSSYFDCASPLSSGFGSYGLVAPRFQHEFNSNRLSLAASSSRSFRADIFRTLYGLAHVFWGGSVVCRFCATSHNGK